MIIHRSFVGTFLQDSKLVNCKNPQIELLVLMFVSDRLRDIKLLEHFFRLLLEQDENQISSECTYAGFVAAATLGKWDDALRFKQLMLGYDRSVFEQIHKASLQRPDSIDYAAFCAFLEKPEHRIPVSKITWEHFYIIDIALDLRSVTGSDQGEVEFVRKSMVEDFELPVLDDSNRILRTGAVASSIGFSSLPIPLAGVFSDDRIQMHGYMDCDPQDDIDRFQCEDISLSLHSSESRLWKGVYSVCYEYRRRSKDGKQISSDVTVEFDIEVKLSLEPEYPQ
jgi:hypothetical protein